MSSLIFYTDTTQAVLATDTLCVDASGAPAFFTSKVFPVPHLRMIIAGTGVAGFATQWFAKVNDGMLLRDIENLDFHTPGALRLQWEQFVESGVWQPGLTSTVYHFGFSGKDGPLCVYAYRSTSDFCSEPLNYGLAVKPACEVVDDEVLSPDSFFALMRQQRTEQELVPTSERIYIGGEIQIAHLTRQGITSFTHAKFDDHDAMEARMYLRP